MRQIELPGCEPIRTKIKGFLDILNNKEDLERIYHFVKLMYIVRTERKKKKKRNL